MKCSDLAPPSDLVLPLQQHPNFARTLALMGRKHRRVSVSDKGRILVTALYIERELGPFGKIGLASRGPIWTSAPEPRAMNRFLRASGRVICNFESHSEMRRNTGAWNLMTPQSITELDLTDSNASRLANAQQKWRNRLRHAQNADITISRSNFDPDKHNWLLEHDRAQQKAKGFRAWPSDVTNAYAVANPKAAQIFVAHKKTGPVAAMLFLRHGPVATYHIGWTNDDGRVDCAHNLLLENAACWLKEQGHVRLDLGQIDTHNAAGLARFKLGTGAQLRVLGGTWLFTPTGTRLATLSNRILRISHDRASRATGEPNHHIARDITSLP
jgi:lipid II:glycine glycyltransferase (peptidoglycan interpeptide bridge formation enzyme)